LNSHSNAAEIKLIIGFQMHEICMKSIFSPNVYIPDVYLSRLHGYFNLLFTLLKCTLNFGRCFF